MSKRVKRENDVTSKRRGRPRQKRPTKSYFSLLFEAFLTEFPDQADRLRRELDITPRTLDRWRSGDAKPKKESEQSKAIGVVVGLVRELRGLAPDAPVEFRVPQIVPPTAADETRSAFFDLVARSKGLGSTLIVQTKDPGRTHEPPPPTKPHYLLDEHQRRHTFTMIVEGIWRLEQQWIETEDVVAREKLRKAWNALHAIRPFIERMTDWTDVDWKRIVGRKDHWKKITRLAEESIEASFAAEPNEYQRRRAALWKEQTQSYDPEVERIRHLEIE